MRSQLLIGACVVAALGVTLTSQRGAGAQVTGAQASPTQAASRAPRNAAELDQLFKQVSNWGRWGKDDQLGAANLITPAKRREATALVKTGATASLSRMLTAQPMAKAPKEISYGWLGGLFEPNLKDDWVMERRLIEYHGGEFTHIDALCHVAYQGKLYNGFGLREVVTRDGGCSKMGIAALKDGVVTRGVLLDLPGKSVGPDDIRAWERQTGLKLSPGDAIFLRTGRDQAGTGRGGYDPSLMPLLKERDIALIGADVAQEGGEVPGVRLPIHRFALVALGVHLIDNMDLEALAATARKLNRWEFLVTASTPPITNGAGAPINPIAVF